MNPAEIPRQAVVLCGGLGTRLKPYTNHLPKPMVDVNGKPFLYYLLRQLSEQGISRFILLTGYLGEKISEYFGDGSRFGWDITYSSGPVEWDTGRRIWEAKSFLDPFFILLYSDNFVHLSIKKIVEKQMQSNKTLTVLLCKKKNGNVKIDELGNIESYSKNPDQNSHSYVEVGYMAINKERFFQACNQIPEFPNFNLSQLLVYLAVNKQMLGFLSDVGYKSISDPDRLKITREFLLPKKYILIDRDGTINSKAPKGEYIKRWQEFSWIPDSVNTMKKLALLGFEFIVITNQAGVARGHMTEIDVDTIHENMIRFLLDEGIKVVRVVSCFDHWDDNSSRRKPSPGMFFEVSKEFNFRLDHVMYIGDDIRDCEAAWNSGCGMVHICENLEESELLNMPTPYIRVNKLSDAFDRIVKIYNDWES